MPALGRGLLAGCIGGMLRLKCDEEIIHYLTHIYEAWSFLFGHNDDAMPKIDAHTVESVESRIPARSSSDENILKPLVEQGDIFETFTPSEREHIWRNLKLYPRRVPSIRLFLKDLLYMETLVGCVKRLVQPGRRQTVFEALRQSFVGPGLQRPASAETVVEGPHFEEGYRRLYLFAMSHLELLRPGSVLLEKGETRQTVEKDPQAWYDFAQEAHQLGFRSQSITDILSHSADRDAARATLRRVRNPTVFVYEEAEFESLTNQMATIFNRARRRDPLDEAPSLVCDGSGEDVKRRSGRPFRNAFEESSGFLTYDNMHMRDVDEVGELTPFFIRRDVYLSFFGPINRIDRSQSGTMGIGLSTPHTPEREPQMGDSVQNDLGELVRRDEILENQITNENHPTTGFSESRGGPGTLPHSPVSSGHYTQASEEHRVGYGLPRLDKNAD